jgi:hypothetical protein
MVLREGSNPAGPMRKRELCSLVRLGTRKVEWPSPSFPGEGNRLRLYTGEARQSCRVERESEGPIVAMKVAKAARARGPYFGHACVRG